jgi:hypothetical protein
MLTTCLMNAGSCRRRARIGPAMEDRRSWINGSRAAATIRLPPPKNSTKVHPIFTNVAKLCLIHKIAGTMLLNAHLPTGYTCLSPKATVAKARPAAISELPCSSFAKSGWLSGCSNVGINDQQWCTANGSCRVPRLQDAATRE